MIKTKKLSSGFEIPVLGIGTFGIGGGHERDYSDDEKYIKAIKDSIDLGFTHIDTAEIYGANHTEELIAKAIEGYDRKKLFIASKVSVDHLNDVLKAAKASLKRLKTDYMDLYLIHAWNPEIPIKETMKALNDLVDKGVVKNIGACNFTIEQLQEAQKYSKAKIVMNQMKFSLWSKTDLKTMEYCRKNDIMITAYKLFGRGRVDTEKIGSLGDLAKKYKITEAQIIINWVISKQNTVAIFKSTDKKHMKECIEALNLNIDKEDHDVMNGLVSC